MRRNISQQSTPPLDRASSKSSKSSSLGTSNTDGGLTDLSHFEDIGLDDDHGIYPRSRNVTTTSFSTTTASTISLKPISLTGGGRPLINGAKSSVIGSGSATRSNSLGDPRRLQVSASLGPATTGQGNVSRSPSPTHMNQRPVSPQSLNRRSSKNELRDSSVAYPIRKSSSSRPRKTAKEIEAEFHDSDEDLPEDASLCNVPLSPGLFRTASSAVNSANVSASTSPERPSYLSTSPRLSHLRPSKTMPLSARTFPLSTNSESPLPSSLRLPQARASTGSLDTFGLGKIRAKSWNNVLSDLSEDVMALSEALDAHANKTGENGGAYVRDTIGDRRRVKSSIVELPPLRRNNIMIDPLPISKEKEKLLSRTRPSWLPPKSPKEERRHLREYKRMMEASMEAEKKRASNIAIAKCARDDTTSMLQRIWDEYVLPNWQQATREPRTRELWWHGIPHRARPEVWKRAITNELGLTSNTFSKALARAQAVEVSTAARDGSAGSEIPKEILWLRAIRRDVRRTLPTLHLFQSGQRLHEQLINLLSAYSMYRSDVGYVYGTHLPAALLLLTLSSMNEAFIALANLLNRPLPLAFLIGDTSGTSRTYELILNLLRTKRPRLYKRLFGPANEGNLALHPEEVFEPMIRTLFLNNCCDPDVPSTPSSSSLSSLSTTTTTTTTTSSAAAVRTAFSTFSFTQSSPQHSAPPTSPRTPTIPNLNSRSLSSSSSRGLTLSLAQRLWDILLFDGDAAIIRTCAGILATKEAALYGSRESVLEILGWNGALRLGEDAGSFGGFKDSHGNGHGSGIGKGTPDTDQQEEAGEAEAVERVMSLIRGIGKQSS